MKNWFYYDENNEIKEIKSVEDLPQNCFGFVYKVTNLMNGKFYIGKKYIFHTQKKKISLTEKNENKKKNIWKDYKQIIKESDWKSYWGSNQQLKEDLKSIGFNNFDREILRYCYSKKNLTYWETSYQFKYDVLTTNSYNSNILGSFYREDFENQ